MKLTLLSIAIASVVASARSGAQSLDEVQPGAAPAVRVEVTGSRIARPDGETALPVQVMTHDDIARGGWTTTAELMAHVSANFVAFNDQSSVGSDDVAGHAYASLRALGAPSTLVLLNGRRLANYAYGAHAVDLNSIPLAALERVEILKDGASSIYGTDAIAGVINFITRRDYRGADVALNGSLTQDGGDSHRQVTLSGGYGDVVKDRFNALLTLDWQKDTGLKARDRSFSSTAYIPGQGFDRLSSATDPANIFGAHGSLLSPALDAGCAPPVSLIHPHRGVPACGYDTGTAVDDIPPTERVNVLARTIFAVNSANQIYAEYVYAWNNLTAHIAPSPVQAAATADGDSIYYPAVGPFYPTAFAAANGLSGDLPIAYRTVALGPRTTEYRTTAQRIVVGDQGEWAGWSYDTGFTRSENSAHTIYRGGFVSSSALATAVYSGLINVFGSLDTQGQSLLQSTQVDGDVRHAKSSSDQIDLHASRDLLNLPAGPLSIAVGGEARRERLADNPGALLASGDVLGGVTPVQPQDAARGATAAYIEFAVPIVDHVDAQLAARYDHYSDFGGTANPKIALRWQPLRSLLVRGSVGTGFRAPDLTELFSPTNTTFSGGESDPVRCPITGNDADCNLGYSVINGGNRRLQPEKSTQYSVGAVWEPLPGNSVAVDYWHIDKRSAIDSVSEDFLFENFAALAPTNVIRGAVDPAYPNLPGPIIAIVGYPQNIGKLRAAGVDFDALARTDASAYGRVSLHINGSLMTNWQQAVLSLPSQSMLGAHGLDSPVPRWKHYASASWESGSWVATIAQTFQSGYTDENPSDITVAPRSVGSYSLWDIQAAYSGFRNVAIIAGVHNLFDRDPPFTNQGDSLQIGYDPTYADPRGRTYYMTLRYAFR